MSKVLFIAVIAAVVLAAMSTSCTAESAALQVPLPKSLNDPEMVRMPKVVGLPFGDFSAQSDAQIREMLQQQFPHFFGNLSKTLRNKDAVRKNKDVLRLELYRWVILDKALQQRKMAGDERVRKLAQYSWECPVCEFVMSHLKSMLADEGCDLASGGFGALCGLIPGIDLFIPVCIGILKEVCGKVVEYIEDDITSDSQLCNLVFGISC